MKYLDFNDLVHFAREMASSQGFYSRLYHDLISMEDDARDELNEYILSRKFTDTMDFIYWLECE